MNSVDLAFVDYFSFLYYGKKISFMEFLVTGKINYKLLLNTFIHTFIVTVIIVGLIISINNLLNGYGFINLFSFDNLFYQKHMTKFLNFFVCAIVITVYHFLRYKKFIKTHINANQ